MNLFLIKKITAFTIAAVALVGCSQSTPKCSDEKTLSIARKILFDQFGQRTQANEKEIKDNILFNFPRASSEDKNIKKITCEAKLVVGNNVQMPITYESQLDDDGHHIVAVSGIRPVDLISLQLGLESAIKAERQKNVEATVESNSCQSGWDCLEQASAEIKACVDEKIKGYQETEDYKAQGTINHEVIKEWIGSCESGETEASPTSNDLASELDDKVLKKYNIDSSNGGSLHTTNDALNVFAEPEAGSKILDTYAAGAVMVFIGETTSLGYVYVSPCNACEKGFVIKSEFVRKTNNH